MAGGRRYLRGLPGRGYFTLTEPGRRGRRVQRIPHDRWEQVSRESLGRIQSVSTDTILCTRPESNDKLRRRWCHASAATNPPRSLRAHANCKVYSYVPSRSRSATQSAPVTYAGERYPAVRTPWNMRRARDRQKSELRTLSIYLLQPCGITSVALGSALDFRQNRQAILTAPEPMRAPKFVR